MPQHFFALIGRDLCADFDEGSVKQITLHVYFRNLHDSFNRCFYIFLWLTILDLFRKF